MSDIVEDCKSNRHCPECQEAADEIERLRKLLSGRARFMEVERLRADLSAAKQVIENIVTSEIDPLKALLREALEALSTDFELWNRQSNVVLRTRIRAALGDNQ